MELTSLTAVSPIDGRYRGQTSGLTAFFSEFALIQYRLRVEVEYFIALAQQKLFVFPLTKANKLRKRYEEFSPEDAQQIKELEKVTNHDVKALEYFLKATLDDLDASEIKEFVHFGLTSQDVNNTAIPLMWKEALENEYYPAISNLILALRKLASDWKDIPMLARTHGQPASPTRLGKEIMVFVERLENQLTLLNQMPLS